MAILDQSAAAEPLDPVSRLLRALFLDRRSLPRGEAERRIAVRHLCRVHPRFADGETTDAPDRHQSPKPRRARPPWLRPVPR